MQLFSDLQSLFGNLIIMLGSIDNGMTKNVINIPAAQASLLRFQEMFSILGRNKQNIINLYYQSLILHPDCVDVKFVALNYCRAISGDWQHGSMDTPYREIPGKIEAITYKTEAQY